jgi:branched-chain amino acid transport system permease protein
MWQQLNPRLKVLVLVALAAMLPLVTHDTYVMRVAGLTGLYVMLALGLNVVAGFAGLLDLGYVAFYGLGAYAYAVLASPHFDLHMPFWFALPLITLAIGLLGRVLGAPSLRLRGDYLAIVTLGFGQIAGLLFLNLDRLKVPFLAEPLNLTGGPNGIINVDDVTLPLIGYTVKSATGYYYLILAAVAVVFLVVLQLNESRIGRAWRSIREDELAAGTMGVDVRQMKLLAFSIGAAIAGAAGALFAAWQGAVFPSNFNVTVLIILYAMVVLGGVGSIWGAALGAVILSILPELLRSPGIARLIFYGALIVSVGALYKRSQRHGAQRHGAQRHILLLLGAALAFGLVLNTTLTLVYPAWGFFTVFRLPSVLSDNQVIGNVAFLLAVALLLGVCRLKGTMRYVLLVPTVYTLIFAWEARLVQEPSITRMLLFGALLVVMMNVRPQGLFGKKWVDKL